MVKQCESYTTSQNRVDEKNRLWWFPGGGTHSKHGVAEYVQRYTCFSYLLFKCISFSPFDIAFFFFVKLLDNNYLIGKFEVNVDMNFLNFLIRKNNLIYAI